MTKDLTNGEILVDEIEEIKEDYYFDVEFYGNNQSNYLEFSWNLKLHLEENDYLEYFYKYCNFCGKFKHNENLYYVDKLDFIDEKGKMPENYNYFHINDSICESCKLKNYQLNSGIADQLCDNYCIKHHI